MPDSTSVPMARLDGQSWMTAKATRLVVAALTKKGVEARFVGGCVRNALLGVPVEDIDIATPLPPDAVMAALKAEGIKVVPTGLAHGTVTAVVEAHAFEITTLRQDVETDGRRATVSYTTDWAEDANRRDFTINAIYADAAGKLFDPVGGLADLAARRVRFIGDPKQRIEEDYLRILRFFRIHAWYGHGTLDADGLAAVTAAADGVLRLSAERIQHELMRLLAAPAPARALGAMADAGILNRIFPEAGGRDRFETLVAIERDKLGRKGDAVLRLAALCLPVAGGVDGLSNRLRLANATRARLAALNASLADVGRDLDPEVSTALQARALYRLGPQTSADAVLLNWADAGTGAKAQPWRALLAHAETWMRPVFALSGRDVVGAGVPKGPAVGRVLAAVEDWWIDADFPSDAEALREQLALAIAALGAKEDGSEKG